MRKEIDLTALEAKELPKHRFKQGIKVLQPVSSVGDASVQMLRYELEHSDEDYAAGLKETKKYIHPAMDAMAVAGVREASKAIGAELNELSRTAVHVSKLVQNGGISMVDLGDKVLLKERLEVLSDLSRYEKWKIRKFREPIYDMILVRDAIDRKKKTMEALEEPLRKHLESADFYNLTQEKTNALLKMYFHSSENDVLKNISPASLTLKEQYRLMRTKDKNHFSETDMAALRLLSRQTRFRESRIHAGQVLNFKRRIENLSMYSYRMDGTTSAGFMQIGYSLQVGMAIYSLGKFALKTGIVTASFAGKYTGTSYLLHRIESKRKEVTAVVTKKAAVAIKESNAYKTASDKMLDVKASVNDIKNRVEQTARVQKYKEMQAQAKERAKVISKKVNQTKAAAKSAGQAVNQTMDKVLSPVRIIGKLAHVVHQFFHTVSLYLFFGAAMILISFLLTVVMTNAVLSIFQTQAEASESVILLEDETYIADMTRSLQKENEERIQEAKDLADCVPANTYVLEGHRISKYGYPDGSGSWISGSKLTYLDGNGMPRLDSVNPIKDCIVMAYVIMDGDFESNERARDDLILDLWELMNPNLQVQESDIYTCPHGCDTFGYSCDNSNDYATISSFQSHGVGFYGNIDGYSPNGDVYTVTCKGCRDDKKKLFYHETKSGYGTASPAAGCTNYEVAYSCYGHSVSVCYGHRNIEVSVKSYSMEDMFLNGLLPSGTGMSYQTYLNQFTGWTDENIEWARNLMGSDWQELYGVDTANG